MKQNINGDRRTNTVKATGLLVVFFLLVCWAPHTLWAKTDKEIFNRAKLALFDRKWDDALKHLQQLKEDFPNSSYRIQAMLHTGQCWEEKKEPKKAIKAYQQFLQLSDNEGLREVANISIIDLNFDLYSIGEKGRVDKVVAFLKSEQLSLRYYAAFKLSYAKDKSVSEKAVEMLEQIIQYEEDESLVDRAKIALMRINPRYLKKMSKPVSQHTMLVIRSYNKESGKVQFNLSIPFSLAQLAIDALPKDTKEVLKKEGVEINSLIKTIMKSGKLFKLESDGTVFEISLK